MHRSRIHAAQRLAIGCVASLLLALAMIGHDVATASTAHGLEMLAPPLGVQPDRIPHAWPVTDGADASFNATLPTIEQCMTSESGVISEGTPARDQGQAAPLALPELMRFERRPITTTPPPGVDSDVRRALMQVWRN